MADDRYTYELKAFGSRIRQMRKERKLSQLDVEAACGMNRTEVSRIENGLKNVEFYTIVRLAEALKASLSDLFPAKNEASK